MFSFYPYVADRKIPLRYRHPKALQQSEKLPKV